MAQILNAGSAHDLMHAQLQELLEALNGLAKAGDWERLESLSETFLPELNEITLAVNNQAKFSVNRTTLEKSLKLLDEATEHCLTRKSQIAPLIAALTAAKTASGTT